jgi:capsular exopolysaccharide synthesis family protein
MAVALLIALVAGIGVLLFLDRLDDRPSSLAEVEESFDEPILGQIPLERSKSRKKGVATIQADDDRHALIEANRNLRSSIAYMSYPGKPPKTIVMTSPIPGDGKSMTSANLAITLARSGSKVLLVDADLRRGVLHGTFAVPATPGLTEVLDGRLDWAKALQSTSEPNLQLLTRGELTRHPGQLFASPALGRFVKAAAAQHEYIVFDTPPVMATDDVSSLAPFVDGVLVVIRIGYTSARVGRAALDVLHLRKMNVLGLVLNAVRPNSSEYYYYKYKEYYGSAG